MLHDREVIAALRVLQNIEAQIALLAATELGEAREAP